MSNITFNFQNQNFVVTGASSGMGRQVAKELAQVGAKVLVIARRREQLIELQNEHPEHVVVASLDVCDYESMELAIQDFVKNNGKLSGAVYAAGIDTTTPIKTYDETDARKITDVSYWSLVKFVQICSKLKNCETGASMVLFSSVSSMRCDKAKFAYSAAKAAVNSFVHSAAKELAGRKIRINSVCPGWVDTELTVNMAKDVNADEVIAKHPLGIGQPEDVSGMVLFLLSDRAKWITGTNIIIDGGFLS